MMLARTTKSLTTRFLSFFFISNLDFFFLLVRPFIDLKSAFYTNNENKIHFASEYITA